VNSPPVETVPPVADHVTAVLELPETVTLNCWEAPSANDKVGGVIVTETPAWDVVTDTVADPDFVASATLVAVTV